MYSVEGGSGKSFIYDPVEKTIEVFRPDGSHDIIKKDNENYGITYQAMEDDTGYDFSKAEPDWELENRRAYWDAKEELDSRKDKEVDEIMAKIDELYLKSQEKEKAAAAKTTAQNRSLYGGYMQEIDPYGEFAEKIAKKGLTKSGYPQYDYEGFKQAFEAQAGDNMQNLRQLKAEIRAALQLAIATENEKLEEALLNYRTNLTKLEQEYLGHGVKQEGRMIRSPQEVEDEAVPYPLIIKKGEEEMRKLNEFLNVREAMNYRTRMSTPVMAAYSMNTQRSLTGYDKSNIIYEPEEQKTGLAIREHLEEKGAKLQWYRGQKAGESSIGIFDEKGQFVCMLQEGKDYYIDEDGKAKYYLSTLTGNDRLYSYLSAADRFEYLGGREKLNQLKEYAGESAEKEGTVSHAVISAMEEIGTDEELQQAIETSKKEGLGTQIWSALDNAWDSLVKGVSGADEAFENAGESLVKGVSGIDEAFASGGESLAKSWDDLGEVLTSKETKEALYYTLYSVLGVLSGGLTTILGSGNDDLDDAFMWINLTRMMAPTSWLPVPATVVEQIGSIVSKGGTIKDAIDYLMQQLFRKE